MSPRLLNSSKPYLFRNAIIRSSSVYTKPLNLANYSILNRTPLNIKNYSTFNQHARTKPKLTMATIKSKIKSYTIFTATSLLILSSVSLCCVVIYLLFKELFSPNGNTQLFNRSVNLLNKNDQIKKLLQCEKNEKLVAFGELILNNKWNMDRPISSIRRFNKIDGKWHILMKFHLKSNKKLGVVHLDAVESQEKKWYLFEVKPKITSLYIDIPGEKRFYLIKSPQSVEKINHAIRPKGILSILNWTPKKD
ncbi:hypothetical protein TBLA_0A08850 [Henningerozyma blattae CBS 6284]|uniref:Mitochondrial import inner membrane translocase subunit Tim21 n=1 Tax=Henningerozyma blattae (strain ATCC 34711 / CBS 6284 / DSM 70876 / NBRC 10599 / NRRL Y-10934 / UCD 77-7) TaxID=1071380 RepID=I2GX22_HENB6|nr:hypothetical protein TBLA_0A08850 [Tetrapisispora blattae CBS 6284]CCH58674.1 hypothetical protein TBLA_0A08850 [Tetrapisispora blattae CBS 6284]